MGRDILVANGGIGATDSDFILDHLDRILDSLQPDVVTVDYMNNDMGSFAAGAVRIWTKTLGITYFEDEYWAVQNRRMTSIIQTVHKHNAACIYMIEPIYDYIYYGSRYVPNTRKFIRENSVRLGAGVIDPDPEFIEHKSEFLFVDQGPHLTRFGSQLLARIMAPEILAVLDAKKEEATWTDKKDK